VTRLAPVSFAVLLCLPAIGCGLGVMQTAKPTPKGHVDLSMGMGFIYNQTVKEREGSGVGFANFPLTLNARFGAHDRMDVGVKLLLLGGVETDVKVNLMPPRHPFALSLQAGIGMAADILSDHAGAFVTHLPVSLLASFDCRGRVEPYLSLAWHFFWIFGRTPDDPPSGGEYAARTGTGDEVLAVTAGVKVRLNRFVSLLFEYNYWHPVVNDPGDFFKFVDNHIVNLGVEIRIPMMRRPMPPSSQAGP
jgi:hypothetical protein